MTTPRSRRRPWRIEYPDAEGRVRVLRTYHYHSSAVAAYPGLVADNPGLMLRIEKHVEFDAAR